MIPFRTLPFLPATLLTVALFAPSAAAQDGAGSLEALGRQNAELSRRVDALAEELERLQFGEVPVADENLPRGLGLAPGASGVFRVDEGLSVAGYGEAVFDQNSNGTDKADFLRAILYVGYKFDEHWVFNSEIEFEHASTGKSGSASIEFATLDHLRSPGFNLRTGLMLMPMGIVNEIHEPVTFSGAHRPETERRILPSTWRENGVGVFGEVGPFDYRAYLVNGLDASGFSAGGLRGGRQKGSKALAEHWAFVGRLDYAMNAVLPGLTFGGSVYAGKSGQNQVDMDTGMDIPDTFVSIYELHAQYHGHGLKLRGLFAQAFVDDAGRLSTALGAGATDSVAKEMLGGYVEIGYDVLPLVWESEMSLEPFFRYEHLDTQHVIASGFSKDAARDYDLFVVGLSFKPIPQVVIKMDYRDFRAETGSIADEFQASIGFVF